MRKYLTLDQLAELWQVDRRTVQRWASGEGVSRPLPVFRIGGTRRVDLDGFKAWILDETKQRSA